MDEFVTRDSVSVSDIFPNFGNLVLQALSRWKKKIYRKFNGYNLLVTGHGVVQIRSVMSYS